MNTDGRDFIKVHQLLFGYDSGHRLISGSTSLDKAAASSALVLSDLSGQGSLPPQSGYLTGYPLPTMGMYALARTWLATEMPRPGCVWTHTLLIDFSDLAAIDDLRLLSLFHRPDVFDRANYAIPLTVDTSKDSNEVLSSLPPTIAPTNDSIESLVLLMEALYNYPEDDILVYSGDKEIESIAVLLWQQQWPRLRRNFRFCTWSDADRSRNKDRFDLQFVPYPNFRKNNPSVKWVDLTAHSISNHKCHCYSDELRDAAEDVITGNRYSIMRKFLWRYGAETEGGRASFMPLARMYHVLEQRADPSYGDIIRAVKEISPPIPSLIGLVMDKICNSLSEAGAVSGEVVEFFIDNMSILDEVPDRVAHEIAMYILHKAPHKLWPMFKSLKPVERQVASAAAHIIKPSEIIEGVRDDRDLFAAILDINPELAASPEIWNASAPIPQLAAWILKNNFHQLPDNILHAMLQSDNPDVPRIGVSIFGQPTIDLAVQQYDMGGIGLKQARRWFDRASEKENALQVAMANTNIHHIGTLEVICLYSRYNQRGISTVNDVWAQSLRNINPGCYELTFHFCAFLLARAFSGVSSEPLALVRYAFKRLHRDLMDRRSDEDSWELLAGELPEVPFWERWDRAHRVRLGVLKLFSELQLASDDLIRVVDADEEVIDLFEMSAKDSSLPAIRNYFRKAEGILSKAKPYSKKLRKGK